MTTPAKILVFTGEGKGKTTGALGHAICAIGRGLHVFMVQFLKPPDSSGEQKAAHYLAPLLVIKPMGRKGFIYKRGRHPVDTLMAQQALEEARTAMMGGKYDVVILDEVNIALYFGLLAVEEVVDFIDSKPDHVELILTGRYARPEIIERADAVQYVRKIKHLFDQGGLPRKGIEH